MEAITNFMPYTWEFGGSLNKVEPELDENGSMIPKVRVLNPGYNDRKSSGYQYLICYGFVEDIRSESNGDKKPTIRTTASFPLGVGRSDASPENLLDEVCKLSITVRRTSGAEEKIVYGVSGGILYLDPWKKVLKNGAIFTATKVCRNIECVLVDKHQSLRIFFLSITKLTDRGYYTIPRRMLEFRYNNAIALNLLVTLAISTDTTKSGVRGIKNEDGFTLVTFMTHMGNFQRRAGKTYSLEYCSRKVDKMKMKFSLGAIGGLSFHVRIDGVISKRLFAEMGFRRNICYCLIDINPWINKLTWSNTCEIRNVAAVLQPSVPRDFMIYDDVFIDNTGKILPSKHA
ncbi:matrix protein [Ghana virus]|uniref:Matrix protein n=1 Tax=Ghana virus TaxID=2847089 RepID=I0E091_9MONO|nr:matrix protein [Ghana virus]AFH96009.1 matrix protein [Ghana virus]